MRGEAVAWAGLLVGLPAAALAQEVAPGALPPVLDLPDAVVTAPLAGSEVDRAKVPANTQVLRRDDLQRTGPASALRALDENVGGVALNQARATNSSPA